MPRRLTAALACLLAPAVAGAVSHYERHHPDVRFRESGLASHDAGEHAAAFAHFLEASRYADKPSQAMVAEAYAQGRGVARDAVLAYVWMDLAAERGYPLFVGKRERLWEALDAAQRERVVPVGLRIYQEYGDAAAKPRLEDILRRGKRESPGSRVGASTPFVDVYTNVSRGDLGASPFLATPTPRYYAPRYWNAAAYWDAVDADWSRLPAGVVEVKPLAPAQD